MFSKLRVLSIDLLIYAVVFLMVFSVFEIAFTGAVRHRMPYMLMMIPLIAGKGNSIANEPDRNSYA